MPSVLISAILSSFLLVRLIKGPWLRYPQYPAVAMVGSGLAAIVVASFSLELADDVVAGNLRRVLRSSPTRSFSKPHACRAGSHLRMREAGSRIRRLTVSTHNIRHARV